MDEQKTNLVRMIYNENAPSSGWSDWFNNPSPPHPVVSCTKLRILVRNHKTLWYKVEMLRSFGYLQSFQIFVHSVLSCQFITSREMINPLMRQKRFKSLRFRMWSGPHQIKIHIVGTNFMEAMSMEYLTDNFCISLDNFEGQVVPENNTKYESKVCYAQLDEK